MKNRTLIELLFVALILLSLSSCKKKETYQPGVWMDAATTEKRMNEIRHPDNTAENIIGIIFAISIAFLIGRDAKKRGMNPWAWGIFTLFFNILALPPYFISRWLKKGKLQSEETYEKRSTMLFRVYLVMVLIGVILAFLSQSEHADMGNTSNVEHTRNNMLLLALFIGGYGAVALIFNYVNKKNINSQPSSLLPNSIKDISQTFKFCQSCGNKIENNDSQFCGKCGAKL